MKLYINAKRLSFEEEDNLIEHEIILSVSDEKFYGYDILIELSEDDKFIKDTLKTIYKKEPIEEWLWLLKSMSYLTSRQKQKF